MMINKHINIIPVICAVFLHLGMAQATQITIINLDDVGEGFNDTSQVNPVGGNTGVTVGEQRLQVFQFASRIWENIIDSNVEIKVEANFDPLTCTSSSAVLGSAGTVTLFRDFANTPVRRTWYPVALANALSGSDLTTLPDIRAIFNTSVDNNNNCLNNTNWYYGLDGNKPSNSMDLLQVVMHEIGHGLGFQTYVNLATGAKFGTPTGRDDIFMLNLEDHSLNTTWDNLTDSQRLVSMTDLGDLHWVGPNVTANIGMYTNGINQGHVQHYAPSSAASGSSVSHFDTAISPDELMEPFITSSPTGPGLAIQLMKDIGWQVFSSNAPVVGEISDISMSGSSTQVQFALRDIDSSSLTFSFISSNNNLINSTDFNVSGSGGLRTIDIFPNIGVVGSSQITLLVFDGVNSVSQQFQLTVSNTIPSINILSPSNGAEFVLTDTVYFEAVAIDSEDGDLSEGVVWTSSIDGLLGTGSQLNANLSVGTHSIEATIIDSGGLVSQKNILINVYGDSDSDGMNDLWEILNFGDLNRDGTGDFDNNGISDLDEYLISISIPDGDLNLDGVVNVLDIMIAQQILNGEVAITPLQMVHADVAPLINDMPVPDGQFNIADMLIITRKAVGLINY